MNCLQPIVRLTATLCAVLGAVASANAQVARNGSLDPSFGAEGKAIMAFPGNLFLDPGSTVHVAQLPSGQVVVAGTVINNAGNEDFAVVMLTADGILDTDYGVNGGRRIGFDRPGSDLDDAVTGMVVQPDGKVILAGTASGDPATDGDDLALVRLTTAGLLDSSFGSGGRVLVPFNLGGVGERGDYSSGLELQDDGRILLAGSSENSDGERDMIVVRLNANGQRDNSFSGDGRVNFNFSPTYGFSAATQVRQLSDGRIAMTGLVLRFNQQGLTADFALARLLANGALDPSFGSGGTAVFDYDVGGAAFDFAQDVVELPEGKLLACGFADVNAPTNRDMACMRFLENGTPDPAFAAVLVPFDRGGNLADSAARIALDDQGRIILAGAAALDADNDNFALARLQPEGELDTSFGNGGTVTHNSCSPACFPVERDNPGTGLALQADSRILAAGPVVDGSGNYRFMVTRSFGDVLFSDDFEE
jgi:uncharacterized delta-60 repeat protein